jgi:hypothetical protein
MLLLFNLPHHFFCLFPSPSLAATNHPNNNWLQQEKTRKSSVREREGVAKQFQIKEQCMKNTIFQVGKDTSNVIGVPAEH